MKERLSEIFSNDKSDKVLICSGSAVKNQSAMQETQETWVQSLCWEDRWRKA